MSEELLPNVLTPIEPEALADALVHAWRKLLATTPSRESILVLLAQSAHETGRWRSCHCWNLGISCWGGYNLARNIQHPTDGIGWPRIWLPGNRRYIRLHGQAINHVEASAVVNMRSIWGADYPHATMTCEIDLLAMMLGRTISASGKRGQTK